MTTAANWFFIKNRGQRKEARRCARCNKNTYLYQDDTLDAEVCCATCNLEEIKLNNENENETRRV